jgi:acyl carrier protein
VSVYVLDQSLHLVGIGIQGEICVAGPGVARGYVNRPELTAERFVRNPFDSDSTLYRTGDRGRWLASGELEFLGRIDRQMKVRGYRIEPGEIEATLCEHPTVRQAIVEIHEPIPGDRRLVAYVVRDEAAATPIAPLREHLRERLPHYMIPHQFIDLDELRLTARGKVDHGALPPPTPVRRSPTQPFVAPRTAFETSIAGIWKEILKVDRIGVQDDFFELGGHSLSLMRIAAAIEQKYGVRPSIRALYEAPTIEDQSIIVRQQCDNSESLP